MRYLPFFLILLLLGSCKTTEENYRTAYDKAIVGRDSAMAFDSTIYGRHRRNVDSRYVTAGNGDTVEVKTMHVKITPDGGGIAEWLAPYSVVVGQFKTLTNARSLRERVVEAGYPRAFIVENAEPYYYIILSSWATEREAVDAAAQLLHSEYPFPMRAPLPYVLHKARR